MNQLGHYELLDVLGQGGMGRVWRARDTRYERIVALKVIAEDKAQEADYLRLFRREADLVGRLNSPHIIPIHNYGEIDSQAYLDMRYVPGQPLSQLVRERGVADIPTALKIVEQAATALDDAHGSGVVHRDVKPANLLVTDKGFVYLADFGIAVVQGHRAHEGSQILGSWGYMAPERFDATTTQGPACDVYALGCVLYFALTGSAPFPGRDLEPLRDAHLHHPPASLMGKVRGMTPRLDAAIRWSLAKDPAQRPESAGRWVAEMHRARRTADSPTGAPRAQGGPKRNRDAGRVVRPSAPRTSAVAAPRGAASFTTAAGASPARVRRPSTSTFTPAVIAALLVLAVLLGAAAAVVLNR